MRFVAGRLITCNYRSGLGDGNIVDVDAAMADT